MHGGRRRTLYMSRAFLLHLILSFYERLNVRSTRRALAEVYVANCMGLQFDAIATRLTLSVIPRARVLSSVLLCALERILPESVRQMQREHALYSGTIVRGDCQWEIAQRIVVRDEDAGAFLRPYTALSAWMALDGSSYQPATPLPKEDITNLLSDLDPLVDRVRHDRLAGGLSYEQAVFVAHCTDTHRRHRKKLRSFYSQEYADSAIVVIPASARGPAEQAVLTTEPLIPEITGDPVHNVLEFRRLVSPMAPDSSNFIYDYEDAVWCLSAEEEAVDLTAWPLPVPLATEAVPLLRSAVKTPAAAFKEKLSHNGAGAESLRRFLEQARCADSITWKAEFRSHAPRGVVARVARRCGARLHSTMEHRQFSDRGKFARELKRVLRFYSRQRLRYRKHRGILRDRQALRVRARRRAVTKKLRAHFKRTLSPLKLESLWAWAEVASAMHKAKVPVLSGTNPVEQFLALLQSMLPPQGRKLSLRWFRVLAQIAYFRHNFGIFSKRSLPRWADGDSILGQRLEGITALCEALRGDAEFNHFQDLWEQFEA